MSNLINSHVPSNIPGGDFAFSRESPCRTLPPLDQVLTLEVLPDPESGKEDQEEQEGTGDSEVEEREGGKFGKKVFFFSPSSGESVDGEASGSGSSGEDGEDAQSTTLSQPSQVTSHPLYHFTRAMTYKCAVEGLIHVDIEQSLGVTQGGDARVGPFSLSRMESSIVGGILQEQVSALDSMAFGIRSHKNTVNASRDNILEDWERRAFKRRGEVRPRGRIPKRAREILTKWALSHRDNPYPSKGFVFVCVCLHCVLCVGECVSFLTSFFSLKIEEKKLLMNECRLSHDQVSNWFINARRR